MDTLTFYVVKSKDGKYLRSTGIGGGEHWVSEIKKAKVWNKIGPAKAQVTFWANHYPDFGVPEIIPFLATPQEPMNLEEHVKKSLRKKTLENLNKKRWEAEKEWSNANVELKRNPTGWRNGQAKESAEKARKKLDSILKSIEEVKNGK